MPDRAGQRQDGLLAEVRDALADPAVRQLLDAAGIPGREPDVRPLYRELGRRGLLAVNWPTEFGGRGASHGDAASVVSELVLGGVPDMAHVLSVQIVGLFILQAGTSEQRQRHLAALASGERLATVLYTEPEVGSDLAALGTTAVRDGDGYRLSGTKMYGLKSRFSELALCAARLVAEPDAPSASRPETTKYQGITLFLVDLTAPGVHRSTVGSIADEQFDRVDLDRAFVDAGDLLGAEGQGWALLNRCLTIERTGLDYSLKALKWYLAALAGVDQHSISAAELVQIGRYGALVSAGRAMALDAVSRLDGGGLEPAAAAAAKYHTSETARDVADWAARWHGFGYQARGLPDRAGLLLEAAYREAPGLTLSAGTSEIMLQIIASAAGQPDGKEW